MTSVELAREWLKLRQRVEELEAHWKDFMRWDESAIMYDWKKRAEAAEAKLAELQCSYDFMSGEAYKREQAEAKLARCVEALEAVVDGAGPFSRDPLTHASNCIEAMRATARAALDAAKGGE